MTVQVYKSKSLSEILSQLEIVAMNSLAKALVTSNLSRALFPNAIVSDTRQIKQDNLFVAIKGSHFDPHSQLKKVMEAGAMAVVCEYLQEDYEIPQFQVKNTRLALAQLANVFESYPSKEMTMVGITGSNGKTTTALMLEHIYKYAKHHVAMIGTVRYGSSNRAESATYTTPEAPKLQALLRSFVEEGIDTVVMEASSMGQHQYRTHLIDYDLMGFLNFSREHLDYHGSLEAYYAAKRKMFLEAKSNAIAVINLDDEWGQRLKKETSAEVLGMGLKDRQGVAFLIRTMTHSLSGSNFEFEIKPGFLTRKRKLLPSGLYSVSLQLQGIHNVMNAMIAMGLALADDIPLDLCIQAIECFASFERRFQKVYDAFSFPQEVLNKLQPHQLFSVFDDHFANIENVYRTKESIEKLDYKNFWMVYAIRGNRGTLINREILETFAENFENLRCPLVIGTLSRDVTTEKDWVTDDEIVIFETIMQQYQIPYILLDDLKDAIECLLDKVDVNDLVLFAGAQGMDPATAIFMDAYLKRYNNINPEWLLDILKPRYCGWVKESKEAYFRRHQISLES